MPLLNFWANVFVTFHSVLFSLEDLHSACALTKDEIFLYHVATQLWLSLVM